MMVSAFRDDAKLVTSSWGWFLFAGIAWIVFAFIVLTFNYTTVWAIAVFFGIGFIFGGIMEFGIAAVAPGWKWLHILVGIVSIIAGFIALIWPGQTFLVLAAIVGWLLLFYGIIDVVFAFSTRHLDNLWWLQLITGLIMVLIGFWAIAPDDATVSTYRGSVLLVVWVGFAALFRGISDLIIGFRLHSAHKALDAPSPA
jgi:uncharacterized membrane protein HdeD (DUF308 family)